MSDNAKRRPRRKTSEETKKKISESMMGKNLGKKRTEEEKAKLKQLISESSTVMTEIETLNEGLKDTIAHIAEELEIKKQVLNKAIKVAYKRSQNKDELSANREELDEVEEVLAAAGNP